MLRNQRFTPGCTYVAYPAGRSWRVALAPTILTLGWILWWLSMFMPAAWTAADWGGRVQPENTWGVMALVLTFGVFFPFRLCGAVGFWDGSTLLLGFFFLHLIALVGMWWPVCFRPRPLVTWFWRFASVGLLLPWYLTCAESAAPGLGMLVCAWGSTLIALSIWITPPRRTVEPRFIVTLFRRLGGGYLMVPPQTKWPSPEPAFPVLQKSQVDRP